jgi:hypothetical protein
MTSQYKMVEAVGPSGTVEAAFNRLAAEGWRFREWLRPFYRDMPLTALFERDPSEAKARPNTGPSKPPGAK